jgi:peptide/nickel transport system substrate-binding protein
MTHRMRFFSTIFVVFTGFVLAACNAPTVQPTATAVSTTAPIATAVPSATPVPAHTLVVCLSEEPQTLYPYGGSSRSMWNVLEGIFDGPFDTANYSTQPVILQKMPSIPDGDAVLKTVDVHLGDAVMDVSGNLVSLQQGTTVLPSACTSPDCAMKWDGMAALKMDQLSVTFKIKPDIKWSDGQPLTAEDSVYSFTLASDAATPTSKSLIDRTASYQALDAQTVVWTGVPGFIEQRYPTYFFLPLPKHAWQGKSAAELLKDDAVTRHPMGWGPYMVDEWTAGDHIRLKKNPNYFRASEGLPKFDIVDFRFLGSPADSALTALVAGECDIVDQNPDFLLQLQSLINTEKNGKLKLYLAQSTDWEHLDFGIRPASYDAPVSSSQAVRPDLFGDVRTRQAVAACINRQKIVDDNFLGLSQVPGGYQPPSSPLYQKDLKPLAYDPAAGEKLLDEVGWKDTDQNPKTPRVAVGVKGVPDGTLFSVNFVTTNASLRQKVADTIKASLGECGVEVKLSKVSPADLFAAGPAGPLFGRNFDLTEFFWENGPRLACQLYSSSQIPTAANHWIGANITGYSNPAYDAACNAASWVRPDQADYVSKNQAAEKLFADELPVIPLYFQLRIAISRPDLCGLKLDLTARSLLSNIEELDYGKPCK